MKIVDTFGPVYSDRVVELDVTGLYLEVEDGSLSCGMMRESCSENCNRVSVQEGWNLSSPCCKRILASGDSMIGSGIYDGDILVVDTNQIAQNRSIVVAELYGEHTVKILYRPRNSQKVYLVPSNPDYETIVVENPEALTIVGVVTANTHTPKRMSNDEILERLDNDEKQERLEALKVRTIEAGYMDDNGRWTSRATNEFKAVWVDRVCEELDIADKWSWASTHLDAGNLKRYLSRLLETNRFDGIDAEVSKILTD